MRKLQIHFALVMLCAGCAPENDETADASPDHAEESPEDEGNETVVRFSFTSPDTGRSIEARRRGREIALVAQPAVLRLSLEKVFTTLNWSFIASNGEDARTACGRQQDRLDAAQAHGLPFFARPYRLESGFRLSRAPTYSDALIQAAVDAAQKKFGRDDFYVVDPVLVASIAFADDGFSSALHNAESNRFDLDDSEDLLIRSIEGEPVNLLSAHVCDLLNEQARFELADDTISFEVDLDVLE